MAQNKKGASLIPQFVANKPDKTTYLNKNVAIMDGWKNEGNKALAFLSIRFVQNKYQCFSDWDKKQMDLFWDFSRRMHESTWEQIYNQSGKGDNKAGFAPTPIPKEKYPIPSFINTLDPMTTLLELRVNGEMRVHGFRDKAIFYICYLDKGHDICN